MGANRFGQLCTELFFVVGFFRSVIPIHPCFLKVTNGRGIGGLPIMTRREFRNIFAEVLYSFHFRGDQQGAIFIMAKVKGNDSNGVSSNHPRLVPGIEQDKSKHALEIVDEFNTFFAVKRQDYFAIAPGLVRIIRSGLPDVFMVVNLTIHGECCLMLGINQRLCTAGYIDNC